MKKLLLLLGFAINLSSVVYSQGPPVFTDSPIFLGLEGRGLRSSIQYISTKSGNSYIVPFGVPYNLTPKILVGAVVPFVSKHPDLADSKTGIGDVALFLKYLLIQNDMRARTFRIAFKIQQIFPSGDSDQQPALGRGAYQTYAGIISGYITTKFGLYNEVGYLGLSDHLKDQFVYKMGFGYAIWPVRYPPRQFNAYLEILGNTSTDGNTILYVAPGLQVIPSRRYLLEAGVQVPLKQDLPAGQKVDLKGFLGTRILIF